MTSSRSVRINHSFKGLISIYRVVYRVFIFLPPLRSVYSEDGGSNVFRKIASFEQMNDALFPSTMDSTSESVWIRQMFGKSNVFRTGATVNADC